MFNGQSQRLTTTIQAEGPPVTFISFSTSPSHSDTKGTVNGFQTGSSVYLITCGVGTEGCRYNGHICRGRSAQSGDMSPRATLDEVLGGAGRASCRKPHLSPLLPP